MYCIFSTYSTVIVKLKLNAFKKYKFIRNYIRDRLIGIGIIVIDVDICSRRRYL